MLDTSSRRAHLSRERAARQHGHGDSSSAVQDADKLVRCICCPSSAFEFMRATDYASTTVDVDAIKARQRGKRSDS